MKPAYAIAVGGWGMAPSEFWGLTPAEFYWILDAKKPVQMYGRMSEYEVDEIYQDAYGEEAQS
ncbi:phage tail assembly chaperone [Kaistia defluvii]